jgi:2'-5' RNA ligase
MQNLLRLFIALELSQEVHDQLAKLILDLKKVSPATVKWVKPENIHLTLKFLGDTPQAKIPTLQAAVENCCLTKKAFQMVAKGAGVFPTKRQPKVMWAGLNAPPELTLLYSALEKTLVDLGYTRETRPFSAHLTLARLNYVSNDPAMEILLKSFFNAESREFGIVNVRRVTLFQSTLASGGSIYTPLARFQLAE